MRKALIVCVAAVMLATAASAAGRPSELNGVIKAENPLGSGSLTWFFLTAYDASLWTDAQSWSMQQTFALTLVYHMSFDTDELVDRTIGEMQKMRPGTSTETWRAALTRAFPPVKSGERITALFLPGKGVRFFHDGAATESIADAAFANIFFDLWLSPKTPEPELRAKLLGISR
jgi:hypothetical protein